jgi:hypothetical protein
MRNIAIVLALSFALAGCDSTISNLLLPMEPTRESIAAPRRELTGAEKESISEAVMLKMGDSPHREFRWFTLVIRPHDHVIDFCGLVSGDDIAGEYGNTGTDLRKYYAQLTFDHGGTLSNVDVISIGRSKNDNAPTMVDSICIQDGYNLLR